MLFLDLDLFKPTTWLSETNGIMGAITNGVRTLCFWIDTIIYQLIINIYDFFEKMCGARLLSTDILNIIAERVGLILGLIMFFSIIFSFIQMLLNPDKITDKDSGAANIIKKAILVVVMLGMSNFVFNTLYKVQDEIIEQNVISQLILPYQMKEYSKDKFGNILSQQLMSAFYQIDTFDDVVNNDVDNINKINECTAINTSFRNQIVNKGGFDLGYMCLNESIDVTVKPSGTTHDEYEDQVYIVNFNGIFSVLAGILVVYMLIMYCLKVGVRMVQLAFLEVISPMAIISYLSPKKDTMFSKWAKIYFSTYIDVFIRIAIINFVVFLISTIFASNTMHGNFQFWESLGNPTGTEQAFFTVVIILALLTFAHKAPDLLKELLPAGASKLGFGLGLKEIVGLEKGAKIGTGILGGAAAGATIGLLGNKLNPFSAIGGALRGGLSGFKGQGLSKTAVGAWKNQKEYQNKLANIKANGGSWLGYQMSRMQQGLGMRTAYDIDLSEYEDNKAIADNYGNAKAEAEKEAVKFSGSYYHSNGLSLAELAKRKDNQSLSDHDRAEAETQYNQLLDAATKFNIAIGRGVKTGKGAVHFDSNYDFSSIIDSTGTTYNSTNLNKIDLKGINDENATIVYNRDYVLREAPGVKPTGDMLADAKNAKTASDNSKAKMSQHSTSSKVSKHKANAGK